MRTRVVCISQTTGSAGEAVGRLVAERLGFRHVDEEIVVRAAEKQEVDPAVVADAEKRKSFLARYLEELGEVAGLDMAYAYGALAAPGFLEDQGAKLGTAEGHRALIREVIRETAEQGDAVIVSHGASMALAGRKDLLRVLVTASFETRTRRMAESLDEQRAARAVKDADAARADYFKRFYRIDGELPTHYDLVVNTDALTPDEAAELVVHAAKR